MNLLAIALLLQGSVMITGGIVLLLSDSDLPIEQIATRRAYATILVVTGTFTALMPLLFMAGVE